MNIGRAFLFSVGFLFFLTAAWGAASLAKSGSLSLNAAGSLIYRLDRDVAPAARPEPTYTVSGAEVLQSICHIRDINADIQVGAVLFPRNLILEQTDVSFINLSRRYTVSHQRQPDGSLSRIVFTLN